MGLFSGLLGLSTAVDENKLMAEYGKYMIDGETIEIGFTLIRDTFVFTNKRLLLIDKQGLTGKKLEIFTFSRMKIFIPSNDFTRFKTEYNHSKL
jgi:hypothetical protein